MRRVARILTLVTAVGCSAKPGTPAPSPSGNAAPTGEVAPAPVTIVYHAFANDRGQVVAVREDGSREVRLSVPDSDSIFAASLPGQRALLGELRTDPTTGGKVLARLLAVTSDGAQRELLGQFDASAYERVGKVQPLGGAVVAEMVRYGDLGRSDLYLLRGGAAPTLLAQRASLVAAAGDRVAFLAGMATPAGIGDLRSVKLDGTGTIVLGGGDGQDRIAQVTGSRILLTTHSSGLGDVRVIGIDGSAADTIGDPSLDERAVGFAGDRVVLSRATAGGHVLASSTATGADLRLLTAAPLDASALAVTADARVLFATAQGALLSVSATGGEPRLLDPTAGKNVRLDQLTSAAAVYVGEGPQALSLRAAALDGSLVSVLFERELTIPYASATTADGHVILHTSFAGELEGGQVYSVKLDGTGLAALGQQVADGEGIPVRGSQADQDFEAVTPSGRVIFETEYEGNLYGAQLVASAAEAPTGQALTPIGSLRFAGLIP
jgi:hypothetical protein